MSNLLSNPISIIAAVTFLSVLVFLYFFTRNGKSDQKIEKLDKFDELYKKISKAR